MNRFYEWLKLLLQEKVNIFIKGATSGWLLAGIFLFGSSLNPQSPFILTYIIKVFAVAVTGLISGFATVFGNDIYRWSKSKVIKKKVIKRKRQNNEKETKIKRAS